MDENKPQAPMEAPRPPRRDLDNWRGDLREQPPAWRRRPRSERVYALLTAARPLIARIGEGQSWE
jgi:hypothetical protein